MHLLDARSAEPTTLRYASVPIIPSQFQADGENR